MKTRQKSLALGMALLLTTVLLTGLSGANGQPLQLRPLANHAGQFVVLEAGQAGKPITLRTRLEMGNWDALDTVETVWLAGLAASKDGPPGLLSLVWAQDDSGWFPSWKLQLHSSSLLPAGLADQKQSSLGKFINLGSVPLPSDHVIEARLSYNPQSGRVDVAVEDLTANSTVFADAFALKPYQGPVYPVAGIESKQTAQKAVQVQQFQSFNVPVPFGVASELMVKEARVFQRLMLTRVTAGQDMALWLGPDADSFAGRLQLVADTDSESVTVVKTAAEARGEELTIPFRAANLPLGATELKLQYVDELGNVWDLSKRRMHVVVANLDVQFGSMTVDKQTLRGQVTVTSQDETVQGLPMRVYATFLKAETQEALGEAQLVFDDSVGKITPKGTKVPLTIPIPGKDRILGLTLDVKFGTEVGVSTTGTQFFMYR